MPDHSFSSNQNQQTCNAWVSYREVNFYKNYHLTLQTFNQTFHSKGMYSIVHKNKKKTYSFHRRPRFINSSERGLR